MSRSKRLELKVFPAWCICINCDAWRKHGPALEHTTDFALSIHSTRRELLRGTIAPTISVQYPSTVPFEVLHRKREISFFQPARERKRDLQFYAKEGSPRSQVCLLNVDEEGALQSATL